MQQIADWLEKLGMSEYAERFAENRIDFSVVASFRSNWKSRLDLAQALVAIFFVATHDAHNLFEQVVQRERPRQLSMMGSPSHVRMMI